MVKYIAPSKYAPNNNLVYTVSQNMFTYNPSVLHHLRVIETTNLIQNRQSVSISIYSDRLQEAYLINGQHLVSLNSTMIECKSISNQRVLLK